MGTPPRVSRRRSVLNQRRLNASVSQTIAEEEHAKPVDLLFSFDGASSEGQVSSQLDIKVLYLITVFAVHELVWSSLQQRSEMFKLPSRCHKQL